MFVHRKFKEIGAIRASQAISQGADNFTKVAEQEPITQRMGYFCSGSSELPAPASFNLEGCSIIPAISSMEAFRTALNSPPRAIVVLTGNPLVLPDMLKRAHDHGKFCMVNIDFIDGLSRDRFAVEFLAEHKVGGLVSTRFETLKAAHSFGMLTVQRTFAIDSAAVNAAKKSLGQFRPDAMEVLPAIVAPRVAKRLLAGFPGLMIIGGGLIESVKEIEALLADGVHSVTTSDPRLWLI